MTKKEKKIRLRLVSLTDNILFYQTNRNKKSKKHIFRNQDTNMKQDLYLACFMGCRVKIIKTDEFKRIQILGFKGNLPSNLIT